MFFFLSLDDLVAKHAAMDDEEENAYELDEGITSMLIEYSVNRMIMWDASLSLVQKVLQEIVVQTHLEESKALELRDKVVVLFADKR